jgi:hypothetical protein
MTDQFMYNFTYNVNSFYGKLEQILDDAGNKIEIKRNYAMHAKEILSPDMSKCELIIDTPVPPVFPRVCNIYIWSVDNHI